MVRSDPKIITGAGVSAGMNLALMLVGYLPVEQKGKEVQLAIEYDPAPPYNSGSPEKAGTGMVEKLVSERRFRGSWPVSK